MSEADQLRAVIGRLVSQIADGRPSCELVETIREGTRGSAERQRAYEDGVIKRLKPDPLDEVIEWFPEYKKLIREQNRTCHATVPGLMTFTVLEKSAK